jgi:hypothetical protein
MVLIRVGNGVSQGPDSLQIFQKGVRYYSGWGYKKSQCIPRWLFLPAILKMGLWRGREAKIQPAVLKSAPL